MKEIWKCKPDWDSVIPCHINDVWLQWKDDLLQITKLEIPRHYFRKCMPNNVEIHVFVDASESAFAAVAYWRYIDDNKQVCVTFISSKTRCSPMKRLSVPRMELQAAVLGVRLMQTIYEEHGLGIDGCTLWSDSMIKSTHRRYKQFVANRVNEILSVSTPDNWRWVPTQYNTADEATRIRHKIEMSADTKWFTGPTFLTLDKELWPLNAINGEDSNDEEEIIKKFALVVAPNELIDIGRFSSYLMLKRTIAWIFRFAARCKGQVFGCNELSLSEIKKAETTLICIAQMQSYSDKMFLLEKKRPLPKHSNVKGLCPFKDKDGILRVGGRLNAASWLPYDVKHPIILHPRHDMTALIVREYHEKLLHQNNETTIAEIRQHFWIPRIRQVLRKIITNCMRCKIDKVKTLQPLMGQLPLDRFTPFVRPFTYTGLDYFGPVTVAIGRRQEKRWVALFTCLTVRAVHLEVAHDLSTDACILAIRNFISRRGTPVRMRSDNGKNFVGLNGDAKQF
ncbi:uncharacterized protein LOC142224646 [Haematobia irritans]|uniref:uncharacterized protein LOC142224646 n=1 Tax=Haematobia irritans TaxID=7368 RepID=UPI003F50575F